MVLEFPFHYLDNYIICATEVIVISFWWPDDVWSLYRLHTLKSCLFITFLTIHCSTIIIIIIFNFISPVALLLNGFVVISIFWSSSFIITILLEVEWLRRNQLRLRLAKNLFQYNIWMFNVHSGENFAIFYAWTPNKSS